MIQNIKYKFIKLSAKRTAVSYRNYRSFCHLGLKKDAKEFRVEETQKIMGLFVFDIKSITKRLFFTMFVFCILALAYFMIETTLYFLFDRLTLRTYPYFMSKYYLCCINTSHMLPSCGERSSSLSCAISQI